jgi:hypothetical protein
MPKEKPKGPRPVEIAIAAVLSAIVGVIGAVAYLALQPLEKVTNLPAEEDRALGRIYYVEGKSGNASHGTWEAKEGAISAGRSGRLQLVEEELNRWAAQRLKGTSAVEMPAVHIEPGVPNFRVADDRLFVTAPLKWSVFGASRTLDGYVSGHFADRGDAPTFERDRVYVGSCPLPEVFARRLFSQVVHSYDLPDAVREGWTNLQTVSIQGNTLDLVIP